MAEIIGAIPYIRCYIRREYLFDRDQAHAGHFVPAVAYAVRCVRGASLWFQCSLGDPYGGAHFLLPIMALVNEPCDHPDGMTYVQPWDCFSTSFGVAELPFIARGEAYVLPDRRPAQYLFTIDFTGSDLADDMDQHKFLHVVRMAQGQIGAFPNNRLLMPDPAFWPLMGDEPPGFRSLDGEFRAEGNQHLMDRPEFVRRIVA